MTATTDLPSPVVPLELRELARIQNLASRQITFSLTLACPLRCAHCIVDASPGKSATTMPLEVAEHYAAQMPELAASGIRYLSFTGGEPLVARRQLAVLSTAARDAGIECGLVSAGYWGRTARLAEETVASVPGITYWDVSVDAFHEPFVPHDYIRRCNDAIRAAGRQMTARFTYTYPMTPEDRRILAFVRSLPDTIVAYQRVRSVGRGADLGIEPRHDYNPMMKPCLTQGMVVRYDGSVAPCCLNLVEARNHPFQLGTAFARPLVEVHADYMAHPLLQLIRAAGFADVMRWLRDSGRRPADAPLPDEVCEVCELVMKDPDDARYLADRAAEPGNQLRIAVLAWKALGEPHMLRAVVRRFADQADSLDGYAEVAALAAAVSPTADVPAARVEEASR